MRMLVIAATMGLVAPATAVQSQTAAGPLQPTEKWVVNFDDAQCLASRNYGTKERPLILALKEPPLGNVMQVSVVRPGWGSRYAGQLPAKIRADGGRPFETTMLEFAVKNPRQQVYRVNLPREQFATVRGAGTLSIRGGSELNVTFALDQMQPLLKVMDECVADLKRVWNVSEGDQPNLGLQQFPNGNVAGLFSSRDYPQIAIRKEASGTVAFVVLIDERGKVADCTVTETSGTAILDSQSCAMIKERAQFTPAIGANGKPAKSSLSQRVTWRIE